MNILRLSTLSLTLVMAVITLGASADGWAAPGECSGPKADRPAACDDGEGGGDTNLRAKFDLTIEPTSTISTINYIIPDGGGVYEDNSKDRVQVGTGSGPGFRFDTNTQNTSKLPRYMKARLVFMTVTGLVTDIKDYEIDFRFNQTTGLDLGSLDTQVGGSCPAGDDCDGTVAASLKYFGGDPVVGFNALNNGILGFGALNAATPPEAEECLSSDSGPITVTRTGPMQWELESPLSGMACRFAIDANGDIECSHSPCGNRPTIIPFKFKFTIDEQV